MIDINEYRGFIEGKSQFTNDNGFDPLFMPNKAFDFQKHLIEWQVNRGRAAILADCGMGKTLMQLAIAQNVVQKTNKPYLILAPLAVVHQTEAESERFGIESKVSRNGEISSKIVITNYEKLHLFDCNDFAGVACDESSILKNFDGSTKAEITDFMRRLNYRLLCTATPAPNDYIELGTSSEALGQLGYMDMLARFFKNDQNSINPSQRGRHNDAWYGCKWRFKPHAERTFWRWMCSWSRAARRPSDLGYSDDRFTLPKLIERQTIVSACRPMPGRLFPTAAKGLSEQRQERKWTVKERCEEVARIVDTGKPAIVWCDLNTEADLCEKLIQGGVQVSGSDSDEVKVEKFRAFEKGQIRVMITKPKIGAFGLNWQHCNHMTFFPSHSFEQYYQAVRRCWRFGQKNDVTVDIITTEGQNDVLVNLQRKSRATERMFESLVSHMNNELNVNKDITFPNSERVPTWL